MKGARVWVLALVLVGVVAIGCGDGDGGEKNAEDQPTELAMPGAEEAAALQDDVSDRSDEDQVEAVGEAWAELFGAEDKAMCAYLHPDLGGPSSCALFVQGALTGSSKVQKSFAGATVEGVNVDGDTATAEFSNGKQVAFARDPDGAWKVAETPRVS